MSICEMCGKEVPVTKPVFIEGSRLSVCQNCAKFGDDYRASQSKSGAPGPSAQVIEQRLQRREQRMQTKDVYRGSETVELIDDYGGVIKKARLAKGMDLDEFAASILEKRGILAKVEANDLIPDDKLVKKLEKALDIKLTEAVSSGGRIGGGQSLQAFLHLADDHRLDLARVALGERLAHAHDGRETGLDDGRRALIHGFVRLPEILAALGVADDDVLGTGIHEHAS